MDDAREQITPHLRPGERLLWTGRPGRAPLLGVRTLVAGVLALVGVGLAVLWWRLVGGVAAFGAGVGAPVDLGGVFPVVRLIGVVAGAGIAVAGLGGLVVDAVLRGGTACAVTDQRALRVRGRSTAEHRVDGDRLEITRSRDGSRVTVVFDPGRREATRSGSMGGGPGTSGSRVVGRFAFDDVEDAGPLVAALDSARSRRPG